MSDANDNSQERRSKSQRIAFDDDNDGMNGGCGGRCAETRQVISTSTKKVSTTKELSSPQQSNHWKSLDHRDGDVLIHTLEELKDRFRADVLAYSTTTTTTTTSSNNNNNSDITRKKRKNNHDNNGGRGATLALIDTLEEELSYRLPSGAVPTAQSSESNTDTDRSSAPKQQKKKTDPDNGGRTMAVWSCVAGYCEALATHKEAHKRYQIFPIPFAALVRLVETEFSARVLDPAKTSAEMAVVTEYDVTNTPKHDRWYLQGVHRETVRAVSNAVWETAPNKKVTKADEEHANSVYVCLRGNIDRKSIDCLGSSVATVAGVRILQEQQQQQQQQPEIDSSEPIATVTSMLALSEDHAYEMHTIEASVAWMDTVTGTCEVAIPGSTKRQKAKRGCRIGETFIGKKACKLLTPESSWLYMFKRPVICSTVPMALVPIVANINCNIKRRAGAGDKNKTKATTSLESRQLYRLKRELLWILYDAGAMTEFPFGLLELGECEGTVGSARGEEWVRSKSGLLEHTEPILRNEELFLEAIRISRDKYGDAQVYPYYYAGHYHKDAGSSGVTDDDDDDDDNEHRFADALEMYSEAARVTSQYRFDTGDCLQLNKHLTSVATLIHEDILTTTTTGPPDSDADAGTNTRVPRVWRHRPNALACCFWFLRWFDHLLRWEEHSSEVSSKAGLTSKNPRFVEIMQMSHKCFLGKLFQTFDHDTRTATLDRFWWNGRKPPKHACIVAAAAAAHPSDDTNNNGKEVPEPATTPAAALSFVPASKRLGNPTTLLAKSLRAAKVQVRDIDLAILDDDDDDDGGGGGKRGRSSKRRRRS